MTQNSNLNLYKTIDIIIDAYNLEMPDLYKRRDPEEPGRAEKEQFEDKLAKLVRKRFNNQKKRLKQRLEWKLPQKQVDDWMRGLDEEMKDPETEAAMYAIIVGAMIQGAQFFEESVGLAIDFEQFNIIASDVARDYVTGWLKGLDDTTLKALREQLVSYAELPGYSLQDAINGLPFDASRAQRIAVTETTRIFGMAESIAGDMLVEANPGVRVIDTWFTNADDRVCIICAPLDGVSVIHGDGFTDINGDIHFYPPAHVNCRCWMLSTVDEEAELG